MSVVVIPTTEQYRKHLDSFFKNSFYDAINDVNGIVHLYDFSDMDIFKQDDFFDADHLNENGAAKFTELITTGIIQIGNR